MVHTEESVIVGNPYTEIITDIFFRNRVHFSQIYVLMLLYNICKYTHYTYICIAFIEIIIITKSLDLLYLHNCI